MLKRVIIHREEFKSKYEVWSLTKGAHTTTTNCLKLGIAWKVGQGGGFGLAKIVWSTFLLRGEIY